MKDEKYDLVVIGSGPAGEKAAAQAAYFDKRVLVVEKEKEPGGAAVHTGTLPSKTLRETAIYVSGQQNRHLYGVTVELDHHAKVPLLMERKNEIARMESARIRSNLKRHGVEYLEGHARFYDEHTVAVGDRLIKADYILVSTGSTPRRPSDIDFPDPRIHDSDEILHIEHLPPSMVILGGGVIGCEYACMFAALDVKVILVDARDRILPFLDHEIVDRLTAAMERLGIELHLGTRWNNIRRDGDVVKADLTEGGTVEAHDLLFAAGRVGRTDDLGLERIDLEPNQRGHLVVDDAYRTSIPHIMAAGDVIGFPALASTSMEQGRVAVCRAFGFDYKQSVTDLLPFGIYTIPEVSALGKTEDACRGESIPHVVGRALYSENARGCITGDIEGMTKLVVHAQTRKVLGVHVIGERASELVHIGQAVMQLDGTVDTFIEMVFNFPTLAESYKYAAYQCLGELGNL